MDSQKEQENQRLKEHCSECGRLKHAVENDSKIELVSGSDACNCDQQTLVESDEPTDSVVSVDVDVSNHPCSSEIPVIFSQQQSDGIPFWKLSIDTNLTIGFVASTIVILILYNDSSDTTGRFTNIVMGCFVFCYEYYLLYAAIVIFRLTERFVSALGRLDVITLITSRIILRAALPGTYLMIALNGFLDFAHFAKVIPFGSAQMWTRVFGTQLEVVVVIFMAVLTICITVMALIHRVSRKMSDTENYIAKKQQ